MEPYAMARAMPFQTGSTPAAEAMPAMSCPNHRPSRLTCVNPSNPGLDLAARVLFKKRYPVHRIAVFVD